jgi:hypothetical protein
MIPYIILFILLVLLTISIYALRKKDVLGPTLFNCPPGSCPTNILTGVKRCPKDDKTIMSAYLEYEVCNKPYTCDNNITPYAIRSDLSTDQNGVCDLGIQCRCSSKPSCPYYTSTVFTVVNGNPYDSSSQYYFQQQNYLQDDKPSDSFCTLSFLNAGRAFDYCNIDYSSIQKAKETFASCSSNASACLNGQLVIYPNDPDHYKDEKLFSYDIACLNIINPCLPNQLPVYNKNIGLIECK